jgi:hypothetical protein
MVQVETAAVAALDKAEAEQSGPGAGGRQYMNMLLQLLRLRQACNHPWLVKGAPGVPDAFSSSMGGSSGTSGSGQAGGARGATAAEVSAVRRLAPDSQAALLQVRVVMRVYLSAYRHGARPWCYRAMASCGLLQGTRCWAHFRAKRVPHGEVTCAQLMGCHVAANC